MKNLTSVLTFELTSLINFTVVSLGRLSSDLRSLSVISILKSKVKKKDLLRVHERDCKGREDLKRAYNGCLVNVR